MATSYSSLEKGGRPRRLSHVTMRRSYRLSAALLLILAAFIWFYTPIEQLGRQYMQTETSKNDKKTVVPLEIHIMSKCPDARDCLRDLILPAMEKISSKVNFTISYIGKSVDEDGVECMHGDTECQGNIVELCAAELYPKPEVYLGFTMCLTDQLQDIPKDSLLESCALEHGLEMSKLDACMSRDDGKYGLNKLRDSFERSKKAGVTKSCTVRLNNKIRCIRDGGEWKDCDGGPKPKDLISDIKALYSNSSVLS